MIPQSQRLKRVLRKYAIDRRLAQLAKARADATQMALMATDRQLIEARRRLSQDGGAQSGADLAASSEWADRLGSASLMLKGSIAQSEKAAEETGQSLRLARGRVDLLDRRIDGLRRSEDDRKDAQAATPKRRAK